MRLWAHLSSALALGAATFVVTTAMAGDLPKDGTFSIANKTAGMFFLKCICGFAAAALALAAVVPSAVAQENMDIFACQFVGGGPPEPLGDREGHALRVVEFSCVGTSGTLSGGVLTRSAIYELDKGTGVLLSGNGVIRKPGLTAVVVLKDAKLSLVVTDGKVTGVTTSGHGSYAMATGSWASLVGKSFTMSTDTKSRRG